MKIDLSIGLFLSLSWIVILGKQERSWQEQPFVFSVQKTLNVKFDQPVVSVKWSLVEMKLMEKLLIPHQI